MGYIQPYKGSVVVSERYGQFSELRSRAQTARSLAGSMAMIQVHEDSPPAVKAVYAEQDRLYFQFLEVPIKESGGTPKYETIPIPGRSEDFHVYSGNSNNTYSLELTFVRSAFQGENEVADDVAIACTRWLQSLQYPTFVGGLEYPPPLCRLILGKFISARGVVTNVEIEHDGPFHSSVLSPSGQIIDYPGICRVSLEFTALNSSPRQASDVMQR